VTRAAIAVSEIFGPTVQGEGPVAGEPTVFVRTGACDFRCSWCDSLHAVLPEHKGEWVSMIPEEVMDQVRELAPDPILVTLSGGNPAMQPLGGVIDVGHALGYRFCVETQGTIAAAWFGDVDVVVLSPKPPSSDQVMNWRRFDRCLALSDPGRTDGGRQVVVKVPIFSEADLDWVEAEVVPRYAVPLYLSVGNPFPPEDSAVIGPTSARGAMDADPERLRGYLVERYEWLVAAVLHRRLRCRVLPQLHVLVHGNRRAV
jgi:7-carboxy-7-deazaguanine synthase